jgi:hypothetical protein
MYLARIGLALSACSLAACLGTSPGEGRDENPDDRRSSVGRILIDVAEMNTPPSLVTLIQSRMRNVEIRRTGSGCPEIDFRGRNSISTPASPSVYVDGQHASNTCVLELISPIDVAYLEVYPMGVANKPGYFSNSGGLILVFTKNGK